MEKENAEQDGQLRVRRYRKIFGIGSIGSIIISLVLYVELQRPENLVNTLPAALARLFYVSLSVVTALSAFVFLGLWVLLEINKPKS